MTRASSEQEVLTYLREEHASLYELAIWTRAAVHDSDPDLFERVYRGWRGVGFHHPEAGYVCAIYPRGEISAPGAGKAGTSATGRLRRAYAARVDLLFEHGASLVDPDGRLIRSGTQTRTLPVMGADARTRAAIEALVQQAIAQRLLR